MRTRGDAEDAEDAFCRFCKQTPLRSAARTYGSWHAQNFYYSIIIRETKTSRRCIFQGDCSFSKAGNRRTAAPTLCVGSPHDGFLFYLYLFVFICMVYPYRIGFCNEKYPPWDGGYVSVSYSPITTIFNPCMLMFISIASLMSARAYLWVRSSSTGRPSFCASFRTSQAWSQSFAW